MRRRSLRAIEAVAGDATQAQIALSALPYPHLEGANPAISATVWAALSYLHRVHSLFPGTLAVEDLVPHG